jgi:hypothetical protein
MLLLISFKRKHMADYLIEYSSIAVPDVTILILWYQLRACQKAIQGHL